MLAGCTEQRFMKKVPPVFPSSRHQSHAPLVCRASACLFLRSMASIACSTLSAEQHRQGKAQAAQYGAVKSKTEARPGRPRNGYGYHPLFRSW